MFFSVIVPVYQAEKYLNRCVDSILAQTYTDFEIILVDDGSSDSSAQLCDDYAKENTCVKVIHKQNGGVVSARKTGALAAKGDYIVSVDSDDYVSNDLLQALYNTINKDKCDIVAFNAIAFDDNSFAKLSNELRPGFYSDMDFVLSGFMYDKNQGNLNFGNMLFSLWSKAVKRELLVDYQTRVPEGIVKGDDLAVLAPMLCECKSISVIEGDYYYYQINQTSLMHGFSNKDVQSCAELFKYLSEYFPSNDIRLNMCAVNMLLEHAIGTVNESSSLKEYKKRISSIYNENVYKYIKAVRSKGLVDSDKLKLLGLKKYPTLLYILYKIKDLI